MSIKKGNNNIMNIHGIVGQEGLRFMFSMKSSNRIWIEGLDVFFRYYSSLDTQDCLKL